MTNLELALNVAKVAAGEATQYHIAIEANRLTAWKATPLAKRGKYVPELDREHLAATIEDYFDVLVDKIRQHAKDNPDGI